VNLRGRSLTEIAGLVCKHLRVHGMEAVVVGGSAITVHVPHVYTSHDIDIAVINGARRRRLQKALEEIGFHTADRIFAHSDTPYTVDFVAETPYIDQHAITNFVEIQTTFGNVRTYHLEDALADRIAAFVHWNDGESLAVAKRTVAAAWEKITRERLDEALSMIDIGYPGAAERITFARERLMEKLK
jgi:hypothetical protein